MCPFTHHCVCLVAKACLLRKLLKLCMVCKAFEAHINQKPAKQSHSTKATLSGGAFIRNFRLTVQNSTKEKNSCKLLFFDG